MYKHSDKIPRNYQRRQPQTPLCVAVVDHTGVVENDTSRRESDSIYHSFKPLKLLSNLCAYYIKNKYITSSLTASSNFMLRIPSFLSPKIDKMSKINIAINFEITQHLPK